MYPRISIDFKKLGYNLDFIHHELTAKGITSSIAVVKAFAGDFDCVNFVAQFPFDYIGDSRIENIVGYQAIQKKKALLRLPMPGEIDKIIKYTDLSLNSELETIVMLNEEASKQNKIHDIILMFDLGDLREGIFFTGEYLNIVKEILSLEHIRLQGIGTNFSCYGGVIPTQDNLAQLVKIKENIEKKFKISIDIISGGNSSSLDMLFFTQVSMPNEINNLRIGEGYLLGKETAYGKDIPHMFHDAFTLKAQIIELKVKPSYPIGEMTLDSFGQKPMIEDIGIINRAILAIGKQDTILSNITPRDPNVKILGGSSDHLICNTTDTEYQLFDILSFDINYPALVHLMHSKYIYKEYIK